ncbi:hypothetical protein [Nitrosospira lacus]|uniref:hypothetical protein n=1 Tax=Nitrosospira lacus TaxID=1288494 RepID=UPI001260018E|nr:hypothetical protein [Nitrosospira lacus]
MYCIHPTRTVPALLAVAFSISLVAGAPLPAWADSGKPYEAARQANANDENTKKIWKENDLKLKVREPLFPNQAKWLAKGYKETAEIVARQGGNPKPILDAAAYFERQSELVSRAGPDDKPPVR